MKDSPATPSATARPPRMTRAEKVSRTRQALLDAAMRVVGEQGHSEASIANITREANVALGTFYMHFDSKQALLDELLPWAGRRAHAFMNEAIEGAATYLEFEVRNFDALVEFAKRNPYYFRLLSESEVATPAAYRDHIDRSIARYAGQLATAHDRGELPHVAPDQFEILATMLTSMKLLLFIRYGGDKGAWPIARASYLAFVTSGILGDDPSVRAQLSEVAGKPAKRSRRG